jgi:hypothetical protein
LDEPKPAYDTTDGSCVAELAVPENDMVKLIKDLQEAIDKHASKLGNTSVEVALDLVRPDRK